MLHFSYDTTFLAFLAVSIAETYRRIVYLKKTAPINPRVECNRPQRGTRPAEYLQTAHGTGLLFNLPREKKQQRAPKKTHSDDDRKPHSRYCPTS